MKVKRKIGVYLSCFLILLFAGCAIRQGRAPQIQPQTALELNLAHQLEQNEKDYRTFFTDAGEAYRAGILTEEQLKELNKVGNHLRMVIQDSNRLFKRWQASRDEPTLAQVNVLVVEASKIILELYAKKAAMIGGKRWCSQPQR